MTHRKLTAAALTTLLVSHVGLAADVATEPYAWKSATIGANGFINGLVFGPTKDAPTYINTDMGGAYRLDGDTWTCLTDWISADDTLNSMGVETLAVDPTDPKKVYIGIGTYMNPSAIVRSDDQGKTFKRTNVDFAMNGNGNGRNTGQRMNVDPNQPSRLLYGTRNKGLYESNDSAATWNKVAALPAAADGNRSTRDVGLVWTLFDKSSGKPGAATPVAYVGNCTAGPDKFFRTLDAGKTWQTIPGQPGGALLAQRAALMPDGKTLFVTMGAGAPGPGGLTGGAVWRCDDPAAEKPAWTEITPKIPGNDNGTNNGGWCGCTLSGETPPTLYVTTLNHYSADGDDILRTHDAGKTWEQLHIKRHRDDRGYPYIKDAGIHWTGAIEVNPNNPDEGYFTTGYGLYRTTNLREAEPTWVYFNKGFEQSAVLELKSPKSGSAYLISAIGDRDGYRHEDFDTSPKYGRLGQANDFGQTKNLSMGNCNDLDIAYDKPEICVRVGSGAQYSNDGGITWSTFANEAPRNNFDEAAARGQRGPRGPRAGYVAISPDATSTVWAPTGAPATVSKREGDGWAKWEPATGLPNNANVISDPAKAGTFYAIGGRAAFISTDGGHTFTRQGDAPQGTRLRGTPGHPGHLWYGANRDGLQHSTDGGKTWTRVAPDVVAVARHVGIGAPKPGSDYPAVFIAATLNNTPGYYRSDDQGQTWVRINDDNHQYGGVTLINGDSRVHGRLYVGSNGRGILVGEPAK